MPTILELKTLIAAYLGDAGSERTIADFTVGGYDLALNALNGARNAAEMAHDFNFQRKLLTLTVSSSTGGSLDDAVIQGTSTTVDIKSIIDLGEFDTYGNFRPVEWTTAEESHERMREENPHWGLRYPTDAQAASWPLGRRRLIIRNNRVYVWPESETAAYTVEIGIEAYVFSADWTASSNTVAVTGGTGVTAVNTTYYRQGMYNSKVLYSNVNPSAGAPAAIYYLWHSGTAWIINQLVGTLGSNYHTRTSTSESPAGAYTGNGTFTGTATATSSEADSTSDIWTTKAADYLQWAAIDDLNMRFKFYVPRTEGNLAPPKDRAASELQKFIDWDIFKYEQYRRHGR